MPGLFAPGEAEKAANYLKLGLKDFLEKYCISGWRDGCIDDAYIEFVAPAKVGFEGTKESWGYPLRHGRCVFLTDKNLCRIHTVKPKECKLTYSCRNKGKRGEHLIERDNVLKEWKDNKINPIVKEFIENAEEMKL